MGLFRDFLRGTAINGYIKDANKVALFLQNLGPSEIALTRAAVILALAFLLLDSDQKNQKILRDGLGGMYDGQSLTKEEEGEITLYNLTLIRNQKHAHADPSPLTQMIASGLPIWLCSFRGLIRAELLPHARIIWAELDRADYTDVKLALMDVYRWAGSHPITQELQKLHSFETPPLFVRI